MINAEPLLDHGVSEILPLGVALVSLVVLVLAVLALRKYLRS